MRHIDVVSICRITANINQLRIGVPGLCTGIAETPGFREACARGNIGTIRISYITNEFRAERRKRIR